MATRSVAVLEAESQFSALLAEVEAGAEVRITRRGRTVVRLVPEPARLASELVEPFWSETVAE
ncbi:type II toxin-antitoxin system Phd/YefM family antitoxin [Cyanobium sp. Morenito 9A2]|uniref:type II toxin-antitoxin system Phd/YefM family antitoxin n=1 Tax=Cyanobium sp. Morenito 9A2 TaxID=2823718 RepID=UPI0020CFE3C1|nr:type II toxin-antitoxin system prevent-host-death family antitoxin [Cyanobium sp. Morenito 9A2]MCP9848930.1 type II toxin-antitoxin system prevent-host-death family antitoxin [Cyanobium sp. Morenito 9A2]